MVLARPLARPGLRPLLGLPPALRQSLYQQRNNVGAVRHFNFQTIVHNTDTAGYVALIPASTMELIHSIGLPWYAVLPLSAVVIRSCLVYPFFQKPLRKSQAERASMQPLVDARMSLLRRKMMRKHVDERKGKWTMRFNRWMYTRHLGISIFNHPYIPIKRGLSFFTLIAASDAIRRLSGAREGLLKFLLGPFDWLSSWIFPLSQQSSDAAAASGTDATATSGLDATAAAVPFSSTPPMVSPTPSSDSLLVSPTEEALASSTSPAAATAADPGLVEAATEASARLTTHSPWFDPTLLTEGPSFCLDLTVADPTLFLPVLFSTSFFASIYFSPRLSSTPSSQTTTTSPTGETIPVESQPALPKATNLQRIAMTIALLSIIPALKMPVALLLYFITNIWVSAIQTRWLAYTLPIRAPPMACRRPVRMAPMKEMVQEEQVEEYLAKQGRGGVPRQK